MNKENEYTQWDGKALETLFINLAKTVRYGSIYDDEAPHNGSEWVDIERPNPRLDLQNSVQAKAEKIKIELLQIQPADESTCLNKNKVYTEMEQFIFSSGDRGLCAVCTEDDRWAKGCYYSAILCGMIYKKHNVSLIGNLYSDDSTHSTFRAHDIDNECVWLSAVDYRNSKREINIFIDYAELEKARMSIINQSEVKELWMPTEGIENDYDTERN